MSLQSDPHLEQHRRELVKKAARALDNARMIRFVEHTGALHSTDLGRTASHYYIKYNSIEVQCNDGHCTIRKEVVVSRCRLLILRQSGNHAAIHCLRTFCTSTLVVWLEALPRVCT